MRAKWLLTAGFVVLTVSGSAQMVGHVQMRVLPDLAPVTDGQAVLALPRVVANAAVSAEVAAGLNARFARLDAAQVAQVRDCRKASKAKDDFEWAQAVTVTMRGPRFLSFYVEQDWDCTGMPHPDDAEEGMVYDVTTGQAVDWPALLPGAVKGYAQNDGSGQVLVKWAPLDKAVQVGLAADCREELRGRGGQFTVWLDGDLGVLKARVTGLPHIDSELCVPEVSLDLATLKRLGVNAVVTDALEAAVKDPSALAVKRRAAARKGR